MGGEAFVLKEVLPSSSNHDPVIYRVPDRLQPIKQMGRGAYGCVSSFVDTLNGKKLAVKKITNCFKDKTDAKRILREIKLLRMLNNPYIINILDIFPPPGFPFEDVYIVTDLMESDLHKVIYSKQQLGADHHRYFIHQILAGLFYLHSANIFHRDLKPSNVLVNKDCALKICDFGLARGIPDEEDTSFTQCVVTRWYRAPEVVLLSKKYDKSIDIWSVGCIWAELIRRKPLMQGANNLDQAKKIIQLLGTPKEEDLYWLESPGPGRVFLSKLEPKPPIDLRQMFHEAVKILEPPQPPPPDTAVSIIAEMLTFDPTKRITVTDAIRHPYFRELHIAQTHENDAGWMVDWSFDDYEPTALRLMRFIYEEARVFHPEIGPIPDGMIDPEEYSGVHPNPGGSTAAI